MRYRLLLAAAALASVAGCGASHASAPKDPWTVRQDAAMACMKAHPVTPEPGMYAGIVIAGDAPGSRTWIAEIATADGELVEAECGNRAQDDCTWPEPASLLGAYVYVVSEGNATADIHRPGDVHVITYRALRLTGWDSP